MWRPSGATAVSCWVMVKVQIYSDLAVRRPGQAKYKVGCHFQFYRTHTVPILLVGAAVKLTMPQVPIAWQVTPLLASVSLDRSARFAVSGVVSQLCSWTWPTYCGTSDNFWRFPALSLLLTCLKIALILLCLKCWRTSNIGAYDVGHWGAVTIAIFSGLPGTIVNTAV